MRRPERKRGERFSLFSISPFTQAIERGTAGSSASTPRRMKMAGSHSAGESSRGARFCAPETVLKGQVSRLLGEMKKTKPEIRRHEAQEALAVVWGRESWHELQAEARRLAASSPSADGSAGQKIGAPSVVAASSAKTAELADASAEQWKDLLRLLVGDDPQNAGWARRALRLAEGVVDALFAQGAQRLSVATLREALELKNVAKLRRGLQPTESEGAAEMAPGVERLREHLLSLPRTAQSHSAMEADRTSQIDAAQEQHQHVIAQLAEPLSVLRDLERHGAMAIVRGRWFETENPSRKDVAALWARCEQPALTKEEVASLEKEIEALERKKLLQEHRIEAVFYEIWVGSESHGPSLKRWCRNVSPDGERTLLDMALWGSESFEPKARSAAAHWLRQADRMRRKLESLDADVAAAKLG
jgi:hypothetical protein